ncbi:polyhydroxyalkanoate synthesis regulator DNA-binding domain-containing protein [Desulfobacterales bacterium HSG16]|nr:polyhydroxyalkanoate synthesis regulator DNA-binding domain-containing protein [Desulfobacterales bacterium HSG16]
MKEKKSVRKIKKYANRKLYDTMDKKYVSLNRLSELIKEGEEVAIKDNETGEDITASIVSQIIAKEKKETKEAEVDESSGVLIQLLRKGSGKFMGVAKKSTSLWQNAMTMAEDEIDKLVNLLIKDKELSESEGSRLKKDMKKRADDFKKWIGDKIDQRINEVLGMMNLANKEQVSEMTDKIEALTLKVQQLEKLQSQVAKAAEAEDEIEDDIEDMTEETAKAS